MLPFSPIQTRQALLQNGWVSDNNIVYANPSYSFLVDINGDCGEVYSDSSSASPFRTGTFSTYKELEQWLTKHT